MTKRFPFLIVCFLGWILMDERCSAAAADPKPVLLQESASLQKNGDVLHHFVVFNALTGEFVSLVKSNNDTAFLKSGKMSFDYKANLTGGSVYKNRILLTYDKDSKKWNESIIPDVTRTKIVQDFISNTVPGSLPFLKGSKAGAEISYKAAHASGDVSETAQRLKTLEGLSDLKDGNLQVKTIDDGVPVKTDIQIDNGKITWIERSSDRVIYRLVNAYKETFDFGDIPTPIGRPLEEVFRIPKYSVEDLTKEGIVGFAVKSEGGEIRVSDVFAGSPADDHDIKVGAVILAIQGVNVSKMDVKAVVDLFKTAPALQVRWKNPAGDLHEETIQKAMKQEVARRVVEKMKPAEK